MIENRLQGEYTLSKQATTPFWQNKTLAQMSESEWESLCDGCGKCCLHKFIEDDEEEEVDADISDEELALLQHAPTDYIREGEELLFTNIVCHLLNDKTCNCTKYAERTRYVPDCVKLTQDNLEDIFFMPDSCTYRRLQEGRGIPSWHPLLHKGKKSAMHKAGMSVRGKVVKDNMVDTNDYEEHLVTWPLADID